MYSIAVLYSMIMTQSEYSVLGMMSATDRLQIVGCGWLRITAWGERSTPALAANMCCDVMLVFTLTSMIAGYLPVLVKLSP